MGPEADAAPAEAATPQSTRAGSAPVQKRAAPATGEGQRSKRAKYTPVACNECKKRKLKCIKEDHQTVCRRCLSNGAECVFIPGPQQTPLKDKDRDATHEREEQHPSQYKNLSDEVAALREQVASLTSSLRELNGKVAHINTRSPAALGGPQHPSPLYATNLPHILYYARHLQNPPADPNVPEEERPKIEEKDVQLAKVAIAISIVMEAQGQNPISTKLIDSVEPVVCRVSGEAFIDLKELQIMTMLSLYWFHCGEELLAWRAIGISGRECLEIGLHRRAILLDNFKDPRQRDLAVRCFWCVYVLDRRWSFGTSLSFGLIDRDIDPELPEPGENYPYLRCMVSYGRLCSKVWEALPPFESPSQFIPKDTVAFLDFMTQNWLNSIPDDLRIRHPRLGLAPRTQPRSMHRLRSLLYLRGNHMRTLIHRHHVLSTASIRADIQSAKLVTEIALDTIQVLTHLNDTSDIYARQQHAFNYFLMSALAVILLAVCHAPGVFTEPCKESFLKAVQLVKGFSRHGHASRRLWKTIRGLLPGVKSLGLRSDPEKADAPQAGDDTEQNAAESRPDDPHQNPGPGERDGRRPENSAWDAWDTSPQANSSIPDMFNMGNDLMNLFDAFGHANGGHPAPPDFPVGFFGVNEQGMSLGDPEEISRRFQGLI
ncbi:putative transcriptional regulatory protein [Colletotrichum siamense]|uniref:putative transcriptional regulatory protein n=1 Tax=Colletotrichum siamense TaxID=690259 RepID=UPI0018723A68|nr:putative transcriptional regulatory protein [Colletotrichum siamense]KAF5510903.1 putative transcriptional regulatory protein [Colletotrichum siamense]